MTTDDVIRNAVVPSVIVNGDSVNVLTMLPNNSVDCCVTSPPYYGLRSYGLPPTSWPSLSFFPMPHLSAVAVSAWNGCLGLEPKPDMYVAHLLLIIRQVRRVLKPTGTFWLNLGDSWASTAQGSYNAPQKMAWREGAEWEHKDIYTNFRPKVGLNPKNMLGIPWRVAFALQAEDWYLRQDVIWAKGLSGPASRDGWSGNPAQESVKDRCVRAHEYMFLLAKSERYWFDSEAIREQGLTQGKKECEHNCRDVWGINVQRSRGAHFATFPEELVRPCIRSGCPVAGIVLDPFGGSGTVGKVCNQEGRRSILIDLNAEYCEMAKSRNTEVPLGV